MALIPRPGQQFAALDGPPGPPGPPGGLSQTVYKALAADISTSSNVFSTMLSQTITTSGGNLLIYFSCSSSNNANNVHGNIFGVFVDGVKQQTAGFTSGGAAHHDSVSMVVKVTGLAAGLHTVTVQWKTDSNTLSCTPVTDENDSAQLLIEEVTT